MTPRLLLENGKVRRFVLVVGMSLILPSTSSLADVHFRELFPSHKLIADRPRIDIVGEIRVGDAREIERLIPIAVAEYQYVGGKPQIPGDPSVRPLVVLDSPGGNVLEAMKMGRALRRARAEIFVLPRSQCASACVLILAAGSTRQAVGFDLGEDAKGPVVAIGLHRPAFPPEKFAALSAAGAKAEYDSLVAQVRSYLSEMGAPDSLFQDMVRVPSQNIEWLNIKRIKSYGLEGEDPAYAEYVHAKGVEHCGTEYMDARDELERCTRGPHTDKEVNACVATFQEKLGHIVTPCGR
jgi:hypothetical protein